MDGAFPHQPVVFQLEQRPFTPLPISHRAYIRQEPLSLPSPHSILRKNAG
jgi:hypothetical protein